MAKHYQTGEPVPEEIFEKLVALKHYNAGMTMLRQLYFGTSLPSSLPSSLPPSFVAGLDLSFLVLGSSLPPSLPLTPSLSLSRVIVLLFPDATHPSFPPSLPPSLRQNGHGAAQQLRPQQQQGQGGREGGRGGRREG